MNGPNSMYKIKPIIKLAEEIELPKCMYRMKVIQNSYYNAGVENVSKISQLTSSVLEQAPLPEVVALESRQEVILEQLAQLKKQMSALRAELKLPPASNATHNATVQSCGDRANEQAPLDIVVNANPKWPPYSLLALSKLSCLMLQCHVHSSVVELPEQAAMFLGTAGTDNCLHPPPVNVRLIWKNVADTELVVSPTRHVVVQGEVNVLRYLSRLGPARYNYELGSPAQVTSADCVLDLCHSLTRSKTQRDRQTYLRALGTHLKKKTTTEFLLGSDRVSLPDIAAWSAVRQVGGAKELTVNLAGWFQRCAETFGLVS